MIPTQKNDSKNNLMKKISQHKIIFFKTEIKSLFKRNQKYLSQERKEEKKEVKKNVGEICDPPLIFDQQKKKKKKKKKKKNGEEN